MNSTMSNNITDDNIINRDANYYFMFSLIWYIYASVSLFISSKFSAICQSEIRVNQQNILNLKHKIDTITANLEKLNDIEQSINDRQYKTNKKIRKQLSKLRAKIRTPVNHIEYELDDMVGVNVVENYLTEDEAENEESNN